MVSVRYVLAAALLTTADAFTLPSRNVAATFTSPLASSRKEVGFDKETGQIAQDSECNPVDEYCALDKETGELIRLTMAEKERIFLDSLQSYYINGRQLLKDDEFDLLKEDLSWNGSKLVQMNRNEAKYLSALEAFNKGKSIMSDDEFDTLKATLKEEKSQFAVSKEPKCYIDTGICSVTWQNDDFRGNLLYLPVGVILSILWVGVSFELIEPFIRINPLLLTALGAFPITKFTKQITNDYIFPNNKISYGPCPSCEAEERVYFGDVFSVPGFGDIASKKCPKCKVKIDVQRDSMRASTLPK